MYKGKSIKPYSKNCWKRAKYVIRQKIAKFDQINDQKGAPGVLSKLYFICKMILGKVFRPNLKRSLHGGTWKTSQNSLFRTLKTNSLKHAGSKKEKNKKKKVSAQP